MHGKSLIIKFLKYFKNIIYFMKKGQYVNTHQPKLSNICTDKNMQWQGLM